MISWAKATRRRWRAIKILIVVSVIIAVVNFSFLKNREGTSSQVNKAHAEERFLNEAPQSVTEFEAKVIPGAGDMGKAHSIPSQTKSEKDAIIKKHAFNKPVSDQISLKRRLSDMRHSDCKKIEIDENSLPSASVILIFNNEALSALLRTVWSIILNTPENLLHEIVLVDDGSTYEEITKVLPEYMASRLPPFVKLHKLKAQTGLIFARTAGAEFATGEVIIFLDSHCEATKGWIQPLLHRIKENPSTVVIPNIDSISDTTLEYRGGPGGISVSVGSFTWSGHFSWEAYSGDRTSAADPAPSPTMAGGLFGMNRKFFWDIGGYDRGMIGWGGENLELSFRVWRCHGRMENIPCSHVGHIFRSFHPYFIPNDSHGVNTMRMAEVWMDDYKRFFYLYRSDLKDKVKNMGDLSDRREIITKLKCESFKWYLDTVIPQKFRMEEDGKDWGRLRNGQWNNLCLDHLQRDMAHHFTQYNMGQYSCHPFQGVSQYLIYTKKDRALRNEYMCANAPPHSNGVSKLQMVGCFQGDISNPSWTHTKDNKMIHDRTGLCLTSPNSMNGAEVVLKPCVDESADILEYKSQQWTFEKV